MANIKRIFSDHPYINASGSYTFLEGNTNVNYQNSDSIPKHYDKFEKKDLYTLSSGDETNEKIIQSWMDEKNGTYDRLKFNSTSYISVDSLYIDWNGGISGETVGTRFYGFIVSQKSLDDNSNLDSIKNTDGSFKSYGDIYDMIYDGNSSLDELGEFWDWNPGNYDENDNPPGLRIDNEIIISDLNNGSAGSPGEPTPTINENRSNVDSNNIQSKEIFYVGNDNSQTITKIFDESTDRADNTIYFIFRLAANRSGGSNDERNNRFHIYEINPEELFLDVAGLPASGKLTLFDLGGGVIVDQTSKDLKPAFKITDFKVSINTTDGAGASYNPNPAYGTITSSILPSQNSIYPISINNLSENLLQINPSREIKLQPTENFNETIPNEFTNYFPVSNVTIGNTETDIQVYYKDEQQRQIASAPTTVGINFYISDYGPNGSILYDRNSLDNVDSSQYLFLIVDWNDTEDKFNSVNDVLIDFPENQLDLLNKQSNNLFKISNIEKKLYNNYVTPGIKKIKTLMFNCTVDSQTNIEPIRWKLITTRLFLDIPINEFPDFAEVGGADYTTIPWPYTTPIIGGISQDSKYIKSIKNTLGGGNLSDTDIIDETFLFDAKENEEIGAGIEKLDLEQVRYFNKAFSMGDFLNIDYNTVYNLGTTFLSNLPFPQYFEEFNSRPSDFSSPENLDVVDINYWNGKGRPDISQRIVNISLGNITLPEYGYADVQPLAYFFNPSGITNNIWYNISGSSTLSGSYWDGNSISSSFSEESLAGQIFISDNLNIDYQRKCQLELNTANLSGKSIDDTSGNLNKGLLIGDYKIKKTQKNQPMRRDSFIKVPKKASNKDGAM